MQFPNPPVPEREVPDLRPSPDQKWWMQGFLFRISMTISWGMHRIAGPMKRAGISPLRTPSRKLVFEDDLSRGLQNWVVEKFDRDEVEVGYSGNRMMVSTKKGVDGVMVWCKHKLPENFMVEYDITPVSESGFYLMYFCTERKDREDILDHIDNKYTTLSLFEKYTKGETNSYHISYRRNDNPTCNLRKNPGLTNGALLKQQALSGILAAGKSHHVVLRKTGSHINLEVDGEAFMNFTDDGTIAGPSYCGGKFGIRQVYDSEGYYQNFRIWDLDKR